MNDRLVIAVVVFFILVFFLLVIVAIVALRQCDVTPIPKMHGESFVESNPRSVIQRPANTGRRRIMQLSEGLAAEGLENAPLAELAFEGMKNFDAEDLASFKHRGESYVVISTGTDKAVVCHSQQESRTITLDNAATDVAIYKGEICFLMQGRVRSISINNAMQNNAWNTVSVTDVQDVMSIEAPHDGSCLHLLCKDAGFVYYDGGVRRQVAAEAIAYGGTKDVYATRTATGMHIVPNDDDVEDADVAAITEDDRFFALNSADNTWLARMRVLEGEPVFFTATKHKTARTLPTKIN